MKTGVPTEPTAELISKVLHDLAQPVTALECGLELAMLQDKTVEEFQARLQKLLGIAQSLHVRMLELRDLQDSSRRVRQDDPT